MKLTDYEKIKIESQCQPLVEKLKSIYISKNPNKEYNYLINIYIKWYRGYLYFCGKYKSESPSRIVDEFDDKFVRLTIIKKDKFDISYMRHTGTWNLIVWGLTLTECLETIEANPTFHPVG